MFDLHMHSHYSFDGEKSPKELIEMGKEANLKYMALADHNEMQGIDEMVHYGEEAGIKVIPAIEFDTLFDGLETDLLGYNLDYKKDYYLTLEKRITKIINDSAYKRYEFFKKEFHIDFTMEDVIKRAGPKGNLYNNMMYLIMHDPKNADHPLLQDYLPGGKRSDMPEINFYWDYCSSGKPYYSRAEYPTIKEMIDRIHADGGIAILAHPWNNFYKREDRLLKLIEYGIDGIEAYSNYHNAEQNAYYEVFAKEHNLIITCGSDYHGYMKPQIKMGEFGYKKDDLDTILDAFLKKINIK